jgi:putative nucleotidyltransferase with HDIG domain
MRTRLEQGALDVPVFPSTARAIIEACEQDDADARRISELVHQDPALAGHFLRVANSPAFAARAPIVTIPQALARLGLSQIRQIAILVAVNTKAFSSKTRAAAASALRHHSVATALWAQEIARLRRHNVEEAFLCGLLQDVGTPALWQLAHEIELRGEAKATAEEIDAHVARLHEAVGAQVVRAWKLSDAVADVVGRHHASATASETVAIVQLADAAARVRAPDQLAMALRDHGAVTALSLYADDIDAMVARGGHVIQSIEALA